MTTLYQWAVRRALPGVVAATLSSRVVCGVIFFGLHVGRVSSLVRACQRRDRHMLPHCFEGLAALHGDAHRVLCVDVLVIAGVDPYVYAAGSAVFPAYVQRVTDALQSSHDVGVAFSVAPDDLSTCVGLLALFWSTWCVTWRPL